MKLARTILFCLLAASGAIAALACGTSDSHGKLWPEDAGSQTPLPEASVPDDGGPTDAAANKPPFDPADEPVTCTTAPCAVELAAGGNHFCARMNDSTVRCWGDDTKGSLGAGTSDDASVDAGAADAGWVVSRVTGLANAEQLSAGGATTCALVTGGSVYCWGGNDSGQLGLDASTPAFDPDRHPTPGSVALPAPAIRVDVGPASVCAVLQSGELWCWGDNSNAQLARATSTTVGTPGKAETGALRIVATAIGTYTSLGVTDIGEVVSWGTMTGTEGSIAGRESSLVLDHRPLAIGLGSVTRLDVGPMTVRDPEPPRWWVYRGIAQACAIVNGDVFCWGDSVMGALGQGLPGLVLQPRRAELESKAAWAQQVAAGGDFTCVRLTDGTVECAGDNAFGALGQDPAKPYAILFERARTFGQRAVKIAASTDTVCALVEDGSVLCWGSNRRGELGQGTTDFDPHASPARVRF